MSTEQDFLKFLKQASRIRRGVPNTVIGFDTNGKPEATLKSSLFGTGHVIEDESTPLPQRANLNFTGAGVVATDNGDTTDVTIAGGGAGGGSAPDLDLAVLFDEFVYSLNAGVTNKYNVVGNLSTAFGEITSWIDGTSNAGVGVGFEIDTADAWTMDSLNNPVDYDGEAVIGIQGVLANQFTFFGYLAGFTKLQGSSSEATAIATVPDAFGFIFDPTISPNWRLISWVGASSTVIQTSIPVVSAQTAVFKLKVVFTVLPSPSLEFFIDNVSQGTITTDITTGFSFMDLYTGNKTAGTQEILLDYWRATSPRKPAL